MSLSTSGSDFTSIIQRSRMLYGVPLFFCFFLGFYKLFFLFLFFGFSTVYPDEDHTAQEIDDFLEFRSRYNQDYTVTEAYEYELLPADLEELLEYTHTKKEYDRSFDFYRSKERALFINEVKSLYIKQKKSVAVDLTNKKMYYHCSPFPSKTKKNIINYKGLYPFSEYDLYFFLTDSLKKYQDDRSTYTFISKKNEKFINFD